MTHLTDDYDNDSIKKLISYPIKGSDKEFYLYIDIGHFCDAENSSSYTIFFEHSVPVTDNDGYTVLIHDPYETTSAVKKSFVLSFLKMSIFKITPKITSIDESLIHESLKL